MDHPADAYLVDEALKRAPVVWVARRDGTDSQAVWCTYVSPVLYVLAGSSEQPTPPALGDNRVRLIVRSKDDRHRLVEVEAAVQVVRPGDDDHDAAWRAVDAARLHRRITPDAQDTPNASHVATDTNAGTGLTLHRLLPT